MIKFILLIYICAIIAIFFLTIKGFGYFAFPIYLVCVFIYFIHRRIKEKKIEKAKESFKILAEVLSEEPTEMKWIDYRFWFYVKSAWFEDLTPDEVVEKWKLFSVPEKQDEKTLQELKEYVIWQREQWENEENEQ